MGITQNLSGFFAVRFFLGVAESGLFPGVVFYLSMWYKRHERVYRVALFFSAASLAGAFGGILAYVCVHCPKSPNILQRTYKALCRALARCPASQA